MGSLSKTYETYVYIVVLLVGATWIWLSRTTVEESTQGRIPAPQAGFLAPDFSGTTLTGERLTLSELRGKTVLVNVWASWCTPCRAEMPAMERVYRDFRSKGFEILAVNAASQDDPAEAKAFVQEQGLTFPVLIDMDGQVSSLYQISSLPTSFFIDAQGVIREVVIGGPMSEALLRIRIQQLLEQANRGES
jgi:peroxiredoxin